MNYIADICNPGNIVPFYKRLTDQWQSRTGDPFTIKAKRNGVIPMQLKLTSAYTNSDFTVTLVGVSSGVSDVSLLYSGGYWSVSCGQGLAFSGNTWITLFNKPTGVEFDCGIYYVRIDVGGNSYFSERIQIVEDSWFDQPSVHEIYFRDDKTHGVVLWENGYTQRLYFDNYKAHPETERNEETTINGEGQEIVLSSVTKHKQNFDMPVLTDYWRYCFTLLRNYTIQSATLKIKHTSTSNEWEMEEFTFTPTNNKIHSQGRFTFVSHREYQGNKVTTKITSC